MRAVKQRPEFELAGAVATVSDLSSALEDAPPDVALIDPTSLDIGLEPILSLAHERTKVLCISSASGPQLYDALARGVDGYLTKDCSEREVCDAIAIIARGGNLIGPGHQRSLADEIRLRHGGQPDRPRMTGREREILRLIATGLSAPEIALALHLSTATVKTHQHHIYEKLGVHDRAAAVAEAMRHGLIE